MQTKEQVAAYNRAYRATHKTKIAAYNEAYNREHRAAVNATRRIYNKRRLAEQKKATLAHYSPGGQTPLCSVQSCGVSDIDMLVIDHVANNGAEERNKGLHGGLGIYVRLRVQGYPNGYQTLCANHNQKKEIERKRNQ